MSVVYPLPKKNLRGVLLYEALLALSVLSLVVLGMLAQMEHALYEANRALLNETGLFTLNNACLFNAKCSDQPTPLVSFYCKQGTQCVSWLPVAHASASYHLPCDQSETDCIQLWFEKDV